MPPQFSNTFLIGQEAKDSSVSEQQGISEIPDSAIVEFRDNPIGASQFLPSSVEKVYAPIGAAQAPPSSSKAADSVPIPSGARVRPSLRSILRRAGTTLQTKQLWEGTVVELRNGGFVAIVNDRTDPKNPKEQVSFEMSDISDEDHPLVQLGSSFYWIIGRKKTHGTVENVSFVHFRRVPAWTSSAVSKIEARANRFDELLRAEE